MSVNNSFDVDLDRLLTDWLEADAAPRAPESLETAFVEGVARTRQRPAWATTERWISMQTRAQLGVMPRALILLLTLALLVAALAASLALAGNLTRADDGARNPLAGLTYFTQEGGVYTTDGTGDPVRLTDEGEFAIGSHWSPDGSRFSYLASASTWDGPFTIMVRDADGSDPIALGEPFESEPFPLVWSPDGSRILFSTDGPDAVPPDGRCRFDGSFCEMRIWSVAADGSAPARVVGDPALAARSPRWTPDGKDIIFAGSDDRAFEYGIYRMDADGSNVERIGDIKGYAYSLYRPALSPDGTTLAASFGPDARDLFLVDLATGEDTLIAGEDADEGDPYWSPDGSMIAFTSLGREITDESRAMLYDVASGEVISLDMTLEVWGWSQDGRSIMGLGPEGVLTVVDVTDPTDPVATEVEGVTEAIGPSWQPSS